MSDYPPYDASLYQACRKCGARGDHRVEYDAISAPSYAHPGAVVSECLLRTCVRCRFQWREAVLS